ncbi:MAG: response regulator transcription factor [Polyangiaceae bacterium]
MKSDILTNVPKVLLVEDTKRLAASLSRGLREEGFDVEVAPGGTSAVARSMSRDLDAMILDLGLPDMDGTEVLRLMRSRGLNMPVLVLTARESTASKVQALDAGADDYLVKPFAFAELLSRLRALLRRAAAPRWAPLAYGDLRLEPSTLVATVSGVEVKLSPREAEILALLLRRAEQTVTRPETWDGVFGYNFDPGTNVVDVHMAHLRSKISASRVQIETIRGVGYQLGLRRSAANE